MHVTIVPREKFPLGQTVLKVNEQRELTYQFTRRYLQEQLLTVLAGTSSNAAAWQRCTQGQSRNNPVSAPSTDA